MSLNSTPLKELRQVKGDAFSNKTITSIFIGILVIVATFLSLSFSRVIEMFVVEQRVTGETSTFVRDMQLTLWGTMFILAVLMYFFIRAIYRHQEQLLSKKLEEKAMDEAILESIGEGMIATDGSGNIIAINNAAEDMLGWSGEDIIGKNFIDVVPATDDSGEYIPKEKRAISYVLINSMKAIPDSIHYVAMPEEVQYVRKDGTHIPISATMNPIILNKILIGAVGILRDVSREKELEETRRDLLSLASHQLRTPLSGVKWLIETLKKGLKGPLNKEQEEYLDEIYKINDRMNSLVQDMLSVLRMESGVTPIKKDNVSTKVIFDAINEILGAAASGRNITLHFSDEHFTIETDATFLRNILESFVSNAITYSPNDTAVYISVRKSPTELVFAVKDSGIGIPPDEQSRLFERFYRASNAKTFNTHGTGLGLYIAGFLAKKIGAHITFETEVNKGSTFYVHIPQH